MRTIFFLLLSSIFCEKILDNWLDNKLDLLKQSPMKIEGDLIIKNEFLGQTCLARLESNLRSTDTKDRLKY